MSKQEIVAAYIAGRIDRREFVRRLSAVGVSTAAATAYAHTLGQSVAARGAGRDARGFVASFQDTPDYPILDTDDDGFTDEEEEECGSDPNDPNSTCDNVGGGEPCAQTVTFVFISDLPIGLLSGTLVINAGAQIVFPTGTPSGGGCTSQSWSFTGNINGLAVSFVLSATLQPSLSLAGPAGVRAFAAQKELVFEIDEVIAWDVPGIDEPVTPLSIPILSTGGTLGINVDETSTVASISPNLEVPFRDISRYEISLLSGLPQTGTGSSAMSNSRKLAPIAVASAGAALLARGLRRLGREG